MGLGIAPEGIVSMCSIVADLALPLRAASRRIQPFLLPQP
jgi:hypothetical protein